MINKVLISQYVNILKDKPYMIVNKIEGYHTYESYLNGFLLGIDISNNISITKDFSSWLGVYYGVENTNAHWTSFLRVKFKGKTEENMIKSLFELFNKFINQLNINDAPSGASVSK